MKCKYSIGLSSLGFLLTTGNNFNVEVVVIIWELNIRLTGRWDLLGDRFFTHQTWGDIVDLLKNRAGDRLNFLLAGVCSSVE